MITVKKKFVTIIYKILIYRFLTHYKKLNFFIFTMYNDAYFEYGKYYKKLTRLIGLGLGNRFYN